MTSHPLPACIDDLNAEWLSHALSSALGPDASVAAFQATVIGEGVGFLGELGRVELTYAGTPADGAPASVVVKLPTREPQPRALATTMGLYEREVGFYRELAETSGARVPRVYHAAFEPSSGGFALVMEDVRNARLGNQLASCSLDEARLVITALAKLHARWWESPKLDTYTWLPASAAHPFFQVMRMGYEQSLPVFLDRYADAFDPVVRRCAEGLSAGWDHFMAPLFTRQRTLCHGDYRLDNLLFGTPGTEDELVMLDWQLCLGASATNDLQYFISGNLRPEVIDQETEGLLDLYHETLAGCGVHQYSRSQLGAEYREASLLQVLRLVLGAAAIDPETYDERGHEVLQVLFGGFAGSLVRYEADQYLPA